jgi:hypothetical protein
MRREEICQVLTTPALALEKIARQPSSTHRNSATLPSRYVRVSFSLGAILNFVTSLSVRHRHPLIASTHLPFSSDKKPCQHKSTELDPKSGSDLEEGTQRSPGVYMRLADANASSTKLPDEK